MPWKCDNERPDPMRLATGGQRRPVSDLVSCRYQKKQGSGLSLLHLMFMLFLRLLRNMIIKDLTPYVS